MEHTEKYDIIQITFGTAWPTWESFLLNEPVKMNWFLNNNIYFSYSASYYFTRYLFALQCIYNHLWTGQFTSWSQCFSAACSFCQDSLVQSSRWSLAEGRTCCSHQTGGWTPAYIVATLPGHNYLQLTPIEFQERGLNPCPQKLVDLQSNDVTIRPSR